MNSYIDVPIPWCVSPTHPKASTWFDLGRVHIGPPNDTALRKIDEPCVRVLDGLNVAWCGHHTLDESKPLRLSLVGFERGEPPPEVRIAMTELQAVEVILGTCEYLLRRIRHRLVCKARQN